MAQALSRADAPAHERSTKGSWGAGPGHARDRPRGLRRRCGDETRAQEAANGNAQSDAADLDRFLMRNGEEPGFRQGALPEQCLDRGETITGVNAFVNGDAAAAGRRAATAQRGVRLVHRRADPRPAGTAGITNVALFETAEGAQHSLAHELRTDVIRAYGPVANLRRFPVPGIPGARGWTASEPHVGNVCGCRVGACSSWETRAPVRSSGRCRRARGRSTSARAATARDPART